MARAVGPRVKPEGDKRGAEGDWGEAQGAEWGGVGGKWRMGRRVEPEVTG